MIYFVIFYHHVVKFKLVYIKHTYAYAYTYTLCCISSKVIVPVTLTTVDLFFFFEGLELLIFPKPQYGYFNAIFPQVMLVNVLLFPFLRNGTRGKWSSLLYIPDFIKTSKTSRQVDDNDTK